MPNALAIGVPYETFWHLTPQKLKAFYKAHEIKIKEQDYLAWISGQYMLSAVSVSVEHNFAGAKAKSKYIEKPLLSENEKKNEENIITEEDKKKQTEKLFMKLKIMGANFNLNKGKSGAN